MTRRVTDMMGNSVEVSDHPTRIISLVPSQTELLCDLGLDDEVIGITKFCVHPNEWFRNKKRVGGTKNVNFKIIDELQPDIIIANKEENTREQVEQLAGKYPVWVSDIKNVADALQMIMAMGEITGKVDRATLLADEISIGFGQLKQAGSPRRVAYFIWRDPWMCAGGDTFISDIIERMGWYNVLKNEPRYPQISLEYLADLSVELILLSSEPYPFKEKHIAEISAVLPHAEVQLVDGEMFSWYGSRMKHAITYLSELLIKK